MENMYSTSLGFTLEWVSNLQVPVAGEESRAELSLIDYCGVRIRLCIHSWFTMVGGGGEGHA
jgi:hypothetical protein